MRRSTKIALALAGLVGLGAAGYAGTVVAQGGPPPWAQGERWGPRGQWGPPGGQWGPPGQWGGPQGEWGGPPGGWRGRGWGQEQQGEQEYRGRGWRGEGGPGQWRGEGGPGEGRGYGMGPGMGRGQGMGPGMGPGMMGPGMGMMGPGMGMMGRGRGIERAFDFFDRNFDGAVEWAEVRAVLERRFARLDANGDGVLNRADIEARIAERVRNAPQRMQERFQQNQERRAEMINRFNERLMGRFGKPADGSISRDEFVAQFEPLFRWMNRTGDGRLTRQQVEEFMAMMRGLRG